MEKVRMIIDGNRMKDIDNVSERIFLPSEQLQVCCDGINVEIVRVNNVALLEDLQIVMCERME